MNKKELANSVQGKVGGTKKTAVEYVEAVLESIQEAVASGSVVKLIGFGNFERKEIKGATGTIQFGDRKGQEWETKDSFKPVFKASELFTNRVNGIVSDVEVEE